MQNIFDVAIIGGGPAGMMAAITAAEKKNNSSELSVVLLEKNDSLGKKILATGNGRCNLTNRFAEKSRYHGGDQQFISNVLSSFDQFKTMQFFEELGIVLKEEDNGRIFPRTNQAQTIIDALNHRLQEDKVNVRLNSIVKRISKNSGNFEITLNDGTVINSKKVVITAGGKSSSQFGSTGDGYYWAENLGHKTTETYPALVPLETVEDWPKELSGLRLEGRTFVTDGDKIISEKNGDILFTHFGLSAPSVMAHAGRIAPFFNHKLTIHLDIFLDLSEKDLDSTLIKIFESSGKKELKNALSGILPNNLSPVVLRLLEIRAEKKTAEISKEDRLKIVKFLKDIPLEIKQTRPFKEAQVTSGGVALDDINEKTLESKKTKGLYFAGEILDVDGDSGGFNLQWAWSSGHLAGNLQ
ncbi:TPA: NAD(P)/FAD-dependent oxidoreductase [Candidatus Berkelbacteria bacterium]|uniref:Flavoprotein n=1 Tax=Berkelbacteria bacterium GW2011_GWE1_39_12 TaxID=1618337 RepID=A0A0G4B3Z5_9BACT|nr:MAG: hypothetical protein UT28_C0001G0799 [Berkelbacteria bacterium GW2011_GWE1_39_12]HBO60332.1 NAD(P)/FAD-dependent oxidoreductase [Candidatus Berkelbacteria bacterium]